MILSSLIVGKGPVVVILHGLFGEGVNWLGISKELASRFEVHLIDQRNHGKSFHDPEHNYFVLAQDLNNYIKEKRISTFSLIGHSMGGKVAINFALLYSNLDRLIIVDILPKEYKEQNNHIFKGLREVINKAKSRKEASCILSTYTNDIVITNFLLKGLFFSINNEPQLKFNLSFLEKNMNNMLSFPEIKLPYDNNIYFIAGSKSNYIQKSDIDYMKLLFPFSQFIEIHDAGHWVHFDQKEQFLHIVNKILK